jgi:hypothetical protein
VVARDHFDGHAGGRACADRIDGLGARRINQVDETDKDEPAFNVAERAELLLTLSTFRGDRQNALSARGHLNDAVEPAGAVERRLLLRSLLQEATPLGQPARPDENVAAPSWS